MRPSTLFSAFLFATVGCGAAASSDTDTTTGEPGGGSEAPVCTPGYEGCPCFEGLCLEGLSCRSELCVDIGVVTGDESTGPSSDPTLEPSTGGSSGGDESSSEGSSGAPADSSSSESSTTEVVIPCTEGEVTCEQEVLTTCTEGALVEQTCDEFCAPLGYGSTSCADASSCQCDEILDQECSLGTSAFCFCLEYFGAGSCTGDDVANYYMLCFMDDPGVAPTLQCFEDYVDGIQVDCDTAANTCL